MLLTATLFGLIFGTMGIPYLTSASLARRAIGWLAGLLLGLLGGLSYATWSSQPITEACIAGGCWGMALGSVLLPHLTVQKKNFADWCQGVFLGSLAGLTIGLLWLFWDRSLGWLAATQLGVWGGVVGLAVPARGEVLSERGARLPGQALRGALMGGVIGLGVGALLAGTIVALDGHGLTQEALNTGLIFPLVFALPGALLSMLLDGESLTFYLNRYGRGSW